MKTKRVSWNDVEKFKKWAKTLPTSQKADCVVGILNGGSTLATIVSKVHNIPLYWVQASSYNGNKQGAMIIRSFIPNDRVIYHKHILVVDDVLDTGKTLTTIDELLCKMFPASIVNLVMLAKDSGTVNMDKQFYPKGGIATVSMKKVPSDVWLIYPWEE